MCLDRATNEVINIGIVVEVDGKKRWRLLQNLNGIKAIYGSSGVSSVEFLLEQTQNLLIKNEPIPPNWNVSLGPKLYANNTNIDALMMELFTRIVTFSRFTKEKDSDRVDESLGTVELRKKVKSIIKAKYRDHMPDFWMDDPIELQNHEGRSVSLDLQVWRPEDAYSSGFAACVSSAWYKSKFYRDSSLNSTFKSLSEAKQIEETKNSKLGVYILRPSPSSAFSPTILSEIDNEIDNLSWLLKKHNIYTKTHDQESSLAEELLSDAAA